MKTIYRLLITLFSLFTVESYIKPTFFHNKPVLRPAMCKHNFADFTVGKKSMNDKYLLIHSLINYVVYDKQDLFYDYCHKNLNYTDIMHIVVAPALQSIIRSNYLNNTTIELYDMIKTKSGHDNDYSVNVFRLNDYRVIDV
jgi:hypothetical protein